VPLALMAVRLLTNRSMAPRLSVTTVNGGPVPFNTWRSPVFSSVTKARTPAWPLRSPLPQPAHLAAHLREPVAPERGKRDLRAGSAWPQFHPHDRRHLRAPRAWRQSAGRRPAGRRDRTQPLRNRVGSDRGHFDAMTSSYIADRFNHLD